VSYVMREGRRIAVEILNPDPPKKKRRQGEPFVNVPIEWARRAAEATKTGRAMVWIELLYKAWRAKSNTVALSNETLNRAGVTRRMKYRTLRAMEEAGLVTIEWRDGRAPRVTIIR
jgi:hypothetical protein